MHLPSRVAALSVAVAAAVSANPFALPSDFDRFAPLSVGISWTPCGRRNAGQCGRFEVPLDYNNASAGKASIAVARHPATKKPKLGTLFLNPGGPDGSGVDMVMGDVASHKIMNTAGGQYDIVSWDPRGVGKSVPRADCFASSRQDNEFWKGTIPRAGIEARGNFDSAQDLIDYYSQVPEVDDLLKRLGQQCLDYSPDTLQYVGTVAAVKDMVALHDYLESPDKEINFWGFSYGTVIGIYFVNMFPKRVGRVVLDGVVDPYFWAERPPHELWSISLRSTDEALSGFLTECAKAGSSRCAFARRGSTIDGQRERISRLIDAAYDYKKAHGPNAAFSSSKIRGELFNAMYHPKDWPMLAETLKYYETKLRSRIAGASTTTGSSDSLQFPEMSRQNDPAHFASGFSYAIQAVTCGDAIDAWSNVTTETVFTEILGTGDVISNMFGPVWGDAGFYCHQWPVRAVERYTGPWDKKLNNKIMVIGNKADPITPLDSAKIVAGNLYHSAVLVEQDDYGHVSLAMHSDCTFEVLKDYFVDNKLPEKWMTVCGTNDELFPASTLTESVSDANDTKSYTSCLHLSTSGIALASAIGFALVSLTVSYIRERKAKAALRAAHFAYGAGEKQGDHFGAMSPEARQNGYAPVLA